MELGRAQQNPPLLTVAVGLPGICPLSIYSVAIFSSCQKPRTPTPIRVWPAPTKWPVSCMDLRRPGGISSNAIRCYLSRLQSNNPAIKYQTAKTLDSAFRWLTLFSMMQFPQARVSRTLTKITIHEALALKTQHIYENFFSMFIKGLPNTECKKDTYPYRERVKEQ